MIRHVVLWRLTSRGRDRLHDIEAALRAQLGRIPGLLRVETGRNVATSRHAVDFALVCDFESHEALNGYHRHPVHMQTRAIVDPLAEAHWIVDYELPTKG